MKSSTLSFNKNRIKISKKLCLLTRKYLIIFNFLFFSDKSLFPVFIFHKIWKNEKIPNRI
ncbi:hypothetical protein EG347_03795 [Chryseobacterium sp. G0186]|nr:hypothetical protein EG347_03795 [Chryseobacterium sp. G0186]